MSAKLKRKKVGRIPSSRHYLVTENIKLAHTIANNFTPYGYLSPELRQDMRSDAYVALVKAAGTWDETNGAPFGAYVGVCITRYLIQNYGRGTRFHVMSDTPMISMSYADGEHYDHGVLDEQLDNLEKADSHKKDAALVKYLLSHICAKYRRILTMTYCKDMKIGQIADRMNINPKCVTNCRINGLKRIRKIINEQSIKPTEDSQWAAQN